MYPESLVTFSQAAELLETDRKTVAGLVKALKIDTRPHPNSGNAKALDSLAMARLANALQRTDSRSAVSA